MLSLNALTYLILFCGFSSKSFQFLWSSETKITIIYFYRCLKLFVLYIIVLINFFAHRKLNIILNSMQDIGPYVNRALSFTLLVIMAPFFRNRDRRYPSWWLQIYLCCPTFLDGEVKGEPSRQQTISLDREQRNIYIPSRGISMRSEARPSDADLFHCASSVLFSKVKLEEWQRSPMHAGWRGIFLRNS